MTSMNNKLDRLLFLPYKHFEGVLKDPEQPNVVKGEFEATCHDDPLDATKDVAADVGQVCSQVVEDSLHLTMETQLASPKFSETNDVELEGCVIHLSHQEVVTKFQMLIPSVDFVIGSSMMIPNAVQVLEPLISHNTPLHIKGILINHEFSCVLVHACHKLAHPLGLYHGLQRILVFDPGICLNFPSFAVLQYYGHLIQHYLVTPTWCLTKCSNDFSAHYRKTLGSLFDYLKPLHIVIFIFDPGSLSHVHTGIDVGFPIGKLHGYYISRIFSYVFTCFHDKPLDIIAFIVPLDGLILHGCYGIILYSWKFNWYMAAIDQRLISEVLANNWFRASRIFMPDRYHDLEYHHNNIPSFIFDPGISFPFALFMRYNAPLFLKLLDASTTFSWYEIAFKGDIAQPWCLTCWTDNAYSGLFSFTIHPTSPSSRDDDYAEVKSLSVIMIPFSGQLMGISLYGDNFVVSPLNLSISIFVIHPLPCGTFPNLFPPLRLVFDPGIFFKVWCLNGRIYECLTYESCTFMLVTVMNEVVCFWGYPCLALSLGEDAVTTNIKNQRAFTLFSGYKIASNLKWTSLYDLLHHVEITLGFSIFSNRNFGLTHEAVVVEQMQIFSYKFVRNFVVILSCDAGVKLCITRQKLKEILNANSKAAVNIECLLYWEAVKSFRKGNLANRVIHFFLLVFAFQLLLICLTICSSGQEAFLNMAVSNFVDLEDKVNFKGRGNVTDEMTMHGNWIYIVVANGLNDVKIGLWANELTWKEILGYIDEEWRKKK